MAKRKRARPKPRPGDRGTTPGRPVSAAAKATTAPGPKDRPRPIWLVLVLLAVGLAVYANSLEGGFVFDDEVWILDNEHIRTLWPIGECLSYGRRPVVGLTLAINYAIGELDPWGYHLVNVAIHLLAGVTLFGIVRRTLYSIASTTSSRKSAPWLALAVALAWTVHPLQTQPVNYIIQRGESLMGLFYLLTLYCVIRGAAAARPIPWYIAAAAACALGMGSKAVMVTAPFMVLLYDWTFLAKSPREAWRRRYGLYIGLAATWLVLVATGVVQGVLNPAANWASVGFGYKGVTPLKYAMTQPEIILRYLKLSFWPSGLCIDHGWPVAESVGQVAVPALVIGGLLAATIWALVKRPRLGFVGAWFFVILAPTSSFVPIKDLAFEHRMYLSLAAVTVAVLLAGQRALGLVCSRFALRENIRTVIGAILVVLLLAALGVRTVLRNRDYRTPSAIWASALEVYPESPRAFHNLAHELGKEGKHEEAIGYYRESLRLDPHSAGAHYNLGYELARLGRYEEAVAEYERALELRPEHYEARNNLGNALAQLGQTDRAIEAFAEAIRQRPDFYEPHYNLGRELAKLGKDQEAITCYNKALKLKPNSAEAHSALGASLVRQGKVDQAIDHYRKAIAIRPDLASAHDLLGNALIMKGRFDEAVTHCTEALRLEPGLADAHANLGIALAQLDRVDEAIAHLGEATRLQPGNASAHKNLGILLDGQGRIDEAITEYREALAIRPNDVAARCALGAALQKQGKLDEAIKEFQAALRVNPQHPEAQRMLNSALKQRGQ